MIVLLNKIVRVFSLYFLSKIPVTCLSLRRVNAGGIKGIQCLSFLCLTLKSQKVLLFCGGLDSLWTEK